MELNDHEQRLAAELGQLVSAPTAERHARIMEAVRAAQPAPRRVISTPWRVALAASLALSILFVGTVGAFAASADALPSSPSYPLRLFGEQIQLRFASPTLREELRVSFAQSRISQARSALKYGDRSDARNLLNDSQNYLNQGKQDLHNVPSGEQGDLQNQLNQAQADVNQAENQLNQSGEQGQ